MFLVALITFLSWMNAAALKPLGPTIRIGANLHRCESPVNAVVLRVDSCEWLASGLWAASQTRGRDCRCHCEDLHHYPHSVDQQFQGGRHHGRPSTSSNSSLLTASVITFAAISPTLRLWKCASIASHPSRSCDSGSSMIRSRPRYCIRSANFARWSGIVGSSLDCCGGRPLLGLGRRKLIPSREQVTCSEPSVTPIVSAICSRLKPRSTRFLMCWSRSGVNLIGRPLAAVSGTADPLASNIGTLPSCLAREASGSGVRLRSPSKGTIFAHDGALPDGSSQGHGYGVSSEMVHHDAWPPVASFGATGEIQKNREAGVYSASRRRRF